MFSLRIINSNHKPKKILDAFIKLSFQFSSFLVVLLFVELNEIILNEMGILESIRTFIKLYKCAMSVIGITIVIGIIITMGIKGIFNTEHDEDIEGINFPKPPIGKPPNGKPPNGCFSKDSVVWTKNETQSNAYAQKVTVDEVIEGSLVRNLDLTLKQKGEYKFSWTRVTDVTVSDGSWSAHSFAFSDGSHITVTSPHLMVTTKDGAFYFVRAENVQIGDVMILNGRETKVEVMKNLIIEGKVAIETEDATIQANDVLVSGLCDYNPDEMVRTTKFEIYVAKYTLNHFGKDYSEMCMDTVAWENVFRINNGF